MKSFQVLAPECPFLVCIVHASRKRTACHFPFKIYLQANKGHLPGHAHTVASGNFLKRPGRNDQCSGDTELHTMCLKQAMVFATVTVYEDHTLRANDVGGYVVVVMYLCGSSWIWYRSKRRGGFYGGAHCDNCDSSSVRHTCWGHISTLDQIPPWTWASKKPTFVPCTQDRQF